MSEKVYDRKERWRSLAVAFRMSPEEKADLDVRARLAALTIQDYVLRRIQERDVIVQGSPRVYKALRNQMTELLEELRRLDCACHANDEFLAILRLVAETASGMQNAAQAETATEILSNSNIATEKTISCVGKHKI